VNVCTWHINATGCWNTILSDNEVMTYFPKTTIFCDVTLQSLIEVCWHFRKWWDGLQGQRGSQATNEHNESTMLIHSVWIVKKWLVFQKFPALLLILQIIPVSHYDLKGALRTCTVNTQHCWSNRVHLHSDRKREH
jgi:hypothetical protein